MTGVDRMVLRPDLFGETQMSGDVDEVDAARAQEYALLSALLVRAPDAALLKRLAELARRRNAARRRARRARAEAASETTAERVEREFFNLFIGIGRGELMPYGSYYLTGFLHERPLARLREDLGQLGIERVEGNCEPEDHAATLCEIMAGLVGGRFAGAAGSDQEIFEKHHGALDRPLLRRPRARRSSRISIARVGTLGRVFMDIETEAFALPS